MKFLTLLLAFLAFTACEQTQSANSGEGQSEKVETVMSKEQQSNLTADGIIASLKEGNTRYRESNLTLRNHAKQISNSASGQSPEAIILSCVDSRVPVENVFDRGIGDLFVARVAGNFVNEGILGSMEYACKVVGSKLILVMGHKQCGAVKAAVDDVKLGNITPMLSKIKPSIGRVEYEGEKTSKNKEFVNMVCESNVEHTIEQIRLQSPILKEMEANGEIKIVGALYDLDNGKVKFFD